MANQGVREGVHPDVWFFIGGLVLAALSGAIGVNLPPESRGPAVFAAFLSVVAAATGGINIVARRANSN